MRVGVDAVPFAYEHTGTVRYLRSILDEMLVLDPTVEFLLYAPMPIAPPLRKGNWRVCLVPGGLLSRPIAWAQHVLPRALYADRVDAFWGQPTNLPLRLRHQCFRVLTVHDLAHYVVPESMRFRIWLRMRLQLASMARAADVVIADSRATANLAHRYLGVRKNCLRVVHAAAQSGFHPVPKEEASVAVAGRFGLPRDYLLAVGTIEPRKDHLTLLRALAAVPGAPLLVLVGGIGWKVKPILAQIRVQEKAGRVRYLGRVDDEWLPALYSAAGLSVYPSLYEGFGLPVLEAMACGCPVLCSDSSSLPEVGGNAAAYFRTGDDSDLARKLRSLLFDEERLTVMSAAGSARARHFSFHRAAQEVLVILRQGVSQSS